MNEIDKELAQIKESDFIVHLEEVAETNDTFGAKEIYQQTKEYVIAQIMAKIERYDISPNRYEYGDEDRGGVCTPSGLDIMKADNGEWVKFESLLQQLKALKARNG